MTLVGQYLLRVLAFTFRGTVRQADSWQTVLGGTALPSIGLGVVYGLLGRHVPTISQAEWASLFGYGLVTWLAVRFVIAPFFIWREQYEETTELRLELSKPERMVMEHLTKHRAKARAKLAAELEDIQTWSFYEIWDESVGLEFGKVAASARRLQAEAGLSEAYSQGWGSLLSAVMEEGKKPNKDLPLNRESERILQLLQKHLVGDLTAEALALQLPKGTAPEKPQ
jgi:hypothetical protein